MQTLLFYYLNQIAKKNIFQIYYLFFYKKLSHFYLLKFLCIIVIKGHSNNLLILF